MIATAPMRPPPDPATDPDGILALTRDLCGFRTGVVARDNTALFARIARELPLTLTRVPSGTEHNGWVVPPLTRVRRARVRHAGRVVLDGSEHPLVVAMGSRSFQGTLPLAQLREHLVSNPALPDAHVFHCAWQYRPWAASWALSIPHRRLTELPEGDYEVDLRIDALPGEMLIGEAVVPGDDPRGFVFNAHTCHPGQANDGMVGVATLIRLMQHLAGRRNRWTYRLVLGPEHLGTVFLLRERTREQLAQLLGGVFVEMTGVPAPLVATRTFLGGHVLDRAFAHVLPRIPGGGLQVGWREGAGNDETVWEAPGVEVPFTELTRRIDTFAPYPEYHSSRDTPDTLDPAAVASASRALRHVVDILERDCTVHRTFDGLVCLSNPRYDLYPDRPEPASDLQATDEVLRWGRLVDHVLRWMDGSRSVLGMAEEVGLPFGEVRDYIQRFADAGLARLTPVQPHRAPITEAEPPTLN